MTENQLADFLMDAVRVHGSVCHTCMFSDNCYEHLEEGISCDWLLSQSAAHEIASKILLWLKIENGEK